MKRVCGLLACLVSFGVALGSAVAQQRQGGIAMSSGLPAQETALFAGSGVCARCHDGLFLENGVDVSPVTLWRATMMGNAAKDPVWLAKVSAEGVELPDLQGVIEDKCITCHSPMLHMELDPASLADLVGDPLYRDGITCTVCHQIQPENFGLYDGFSGGFLINDTRRIFGPYPSPMAGPMVNNSNYTPEEAYLASGSGWVINHAEHCATCHNLFTNYKIGENQDGTTILSTEKFPEQTPYYEWLNSDYPDLGITCQGCHMPYTDTHIAIATRPRQLQTRSPFWYHEFVGGNTFMLGMLRDNVADLGLTATAAQFDDKILDTETLLLNTTVELAATGSVRGESLTVNVTTTNRAGHKLPTGIPLRRVWIHLTVTDSSGKTFESGGWDAASGEILGLDNEYEPHYEVISAGDEVQIYEAVMQTDPRADPDGLTYVTRTLLLAGSYAKDNRLPPAGFSKDDPKYPYIPIVGAAALDGDFNADDSGKDTVTYVIGPVASGTATVDVEVCYQSVTPGEANYLMGYDTPEAQDFSTLYNMADNTPAILRSISFDVTVPAP